MSITYASPNFRVEDADLDDEELDPDETPDEEESDAVLPPKETPAEG